jgi:hypothetical protein
MGRESKKMKIRRDEAPADKELDNPAEETPSDEKAATLPDEMEKGSDSVSEEDAPVQPKGTRRSIGATPELTQVCGGINAEQPDIVPGSWVKINGLVSSPEHNGETALVFGFNTERGRYKVFLANTFIGKRDTDKVLNVKPQNIELHGDFNDNVGFRHANPECVSAPAYMYASIYISLFALPENCELACF